jgi:hypothetical protein
MQQNVLILASMKLSMIFDKRGNMCKVTKLEGFIDLLKDTKQNVTALRWIKKQILM